MSGPNHHHIPVFLQKGFAIPKSRAKQIWVWKAGEEPDVGIIKKTGSADHFYTPALDSQITDLETPLAIEFRAIRDLPIGAKPHAEHAANCILHFSSRTAHLRGTMQIGFIQLSENAAKLFDEPGNLANILGMNAAKPTQKFKELLWDAIAKHFDPETLRIPKDVVERIAFAVVKEQFSESLEAALPAFWSMFATWARESPGLVRESHNTALERIINADENPRLDHLAEFDWAVEAAPAEGAILPDCVVIAIGKDGQHGPYMHHDRNNTQAVVLPLSSQKLLVGTPKGESKPDLSDINKVSAASSHDFFLSSSDATEIEVLHTLIGSRFSQFIDEVVAKAFDDYIPAPNPPAQSDAEDAGSTQATDSRSSSWSYELSLEGWGDEDYAKAAGERLRDLVEPLAQLMPLHRLERMVFAFDYASALANVERGFDCDAPVTTVDNELGKGVAKTLPVLRDGEIKTVIVYDASILYHLIEGTPADAEWAVRVIVHQLALVAMVEWLEATLPGIQLKPVEGTILDGWLYREADAAIHAYVASQISAGFGDKRECADSYRELLIGALGQISKVILPERLKYRRNGDLDELISKTMPTIQLILMFAADLLGHCHGSGEPLFDEGGELKEALETNGLEKWLPIFAADLERFSRRLGAWGSFDEFLVFNIHVERLLWQVGIIPWLDGETLMLEVPLQSDAEQLGLNNE